MEIDYTGFAIRLEFLMREKGITQTELAKRTGLYDNTITKWRKGERGIRYTSDLMKIANEFNVNPNWLLYGFIRR